MLNVEIKANSRYPIRRKRIKKIIEEVLEEFQVLVLSSEFRVLGRKKEERNIEVEVTIIGDRKMKEMKGKYLGIDETTDVLSFPLQESLIKSMDSRSLLSAKSRMTQKKDVNNDNFVEFPDGILRLGSIFVSYPQAQRQANLHKLTIDEEIDQLIEHGMLHLLGIHHE